MTISIIFLLVVIMLLMFLLGAVVDKYNKLKMEIRSLRSKYKDLEKIYKDILTQTEVLKSVINNRK